MKPLSLLLIVSCTCLPNVLAENLEQRHQFGIQNGTHDGVWQGPIKYASWVDDDTVVYWSQSGTLTCRTLRAAKPLWQVRHLEGVYSWSVDRKNRNVALIRKQLITDGWSVSVFDCITGKLRFFADKPQLERLLGTGSQRPVCVLLMPSGGRLVICMSAEYYSRSAFILDGTFQKVDSSFHIDAYASCATLSPDGTTVTTIADENVISVREIMADKEIYFSGNRIFKKPEPVFSSSSDVPFISNARHDGKETLIWSVDNSWGSGTVNVSNIVTKKVISFDARNGHVVMDVDFDRQRIALSGTSKDLTVVDFGGQVITDLKKAASRRNAAIEFSPSGNQILVGSWDHTLTIYRIKE